MGKTPENKSGSQLCDMPFNWNWIELIKSKMVPMGNMVPMRGIKVPMGHIGSIDSKKWFDHFISIQFNSFQFNLIEVELDWVVNKLRWWIRSDKIRSDQIRSD